MDCPELAEAGEPPPHAKRPEPTPRDLMNIVKTDKPIKLGRQLGVAESDLDLVKRNHPTDHDEQLSDVLSLYMKQSVRPSWEEVATALRNIGDNRTAQKIADKYATGKLSSISGELQLKDIFRKPFVGGFLKSDPDHPLVGSEECEQEKPEDDLVMGKKAEILDSEENITREFADFSRRASDLMEKKKVRLPKVKLTWKVYKKGELSEEASTASDITSFLAAISGSQGPYAYRNLSALLISFCGKKGKELVAEYEQKLELHLQPRVIPTQQDGKRFVVKVDGKLDRTDELDFRITLAKLFKCSPQDFILEDIRTGSTELTYIIPAEVADRVQACISMCKEDFKNAKILLLTLEGHILWSASSGQTEAEKELTSNKEFVSEGKIESVSLHRPKDLQPLQLPTTAHTKPTLTADPRYLLIPSGPTIPDYQPMPIGIVTGSTTQSSDQLVVQQREARVLENLSPTEELGEGEGITSKMKTATAAAFFSSISTAAQRDSRLTAEESQSLQLNPQNTAENQLLLRERIRMHDELEALLQRAREETDFTEYMAEDEDPNQVIQSLVAEATHVFGIGPAGLGTFNYGQLFYRGYDICVSYLRRHVMTLIGFVAAHVAYFYFFMRRTVFFSWLHGRWSLPQRCVSAVSRIDNYSHGLFHGIIISTVAAAVASLWLES